MTKPNKYWYLLLLIPLLFIIKFRSKMSVSIKSLTLSSNMKAFLFMIRKCEGTAGANGYKTLFGGKLFGFFAMHPNVRVPFGKTYSTAAGAYQFLFSTWERVRIKLNLPDFSPASQDLGAIELIKEKGAYNDVLNGNFTTAVSKVRKVWASLPGAGYGQPEKSLSSVTNYYLTAGGKIA